MVLCQHHASEVPRYVLSDANSELAAEVTKLRRDLEQIRAQLGRPLHPAASATFGLFLELWHYRRRYSGINDGTCGLARCGLDDRIVNRLRGVPAAAEARASGRTRCRNRRCSYVVKCLWGDGTCGSNE